MAQSHYSSYEVRRRGQELYAQRLRAEVEGETNQGKQIVIDIESGNYEVDADLVAAVRRLLEKDANAALWTMQIGSDTTRQPPEDAASTLLL